MEIALSKDEVAFAERMRNFFTSEIPAEIRARGDRGEHVTRDDFVTTQQILNAHGLGRAATGRSSGAGRTGRRSSATCGPKRWRSPTSRRRSRSTLRWSGR